MKLHYQISGEGQPLIIIHGLFGSSDNWRSLARYFARQNQVISVDLRNHGGSPHSDKQDFVSMAEDIQDVCLQLRLSNVAIIGHSLGGKVAMQFADLHADAVTKLVIVDIAPRRYFSQHTPLMDAMLAVDLSRFTSRSEIDDALAASISDKTVRQFLLMNLVNEKDVFRWRLNLPVLKQQYQQLMAPVCESASLHMPALFIYGEESDYVNEADRQLIANTFTHAQFTCIAGAGHWVQADKPQQFKKIVEEFLNNG